MKKLLFVLLVLLGLGGTAGASELSEVSKVIDLPTFLYAPSEASVFSLESTPEESLYYHLEECVLATCPNSVMENSYAFSLIDFEIPFVSDKSTDEEAKAAAAVVNYTDGKLTQAEVFEIYTSVAYNHPEIGNLITGGGISSYPDNAGNLYCNYFVPSFRPVFNEATYNSLATESEKADYLLSTHNQEEYLKAVNYAYSAAISPDMTDTWQKLLGIHNYLVNNASYSPTHTTTADVKNEYNKKTNYLVHSPYSALVGEQVTVCQGYSLAFKLLCDMAGIECGYATYPGHIWNVVNVDGKYYHIDITWDDPTKVSGGGYYCTQQHSYYANFLLSDEQLGKTHQSWTSAMPPCEDSSLHTSIFGGELDTIGAPMYWENGSFWYETLDHYLGDGTLYHEPSGLYYNLPDKTSRSVSVANHADYLPDMRLEAKMYAPFAYEGDSSGYIAIDGTPNSSAKLYAARFSGNNYSGTEIIDITFDKYGRAVGTFPLTATKLMLFENGSIKPLAYAK